MIPTDAEAVSSDEIKPPLDVYRLGLVPYAEAWAIQRVLVERRKRDLIPDTLLILEHPPVITLGRHQGSSSLLFSEAHLDGLGVSLVESDRGGDATYHGPGQLVAYPILDLRGHSRDIPKFVRRLEQTMIEVMDAYGLRGERLEGAPGVWLSAPDRKVGAVGARVSRWVTHHGLALNVNTQLEHFQLIVPCGLTGKGVTSLERELGEILDFSNVCDHFIQHFTRLFSREATLRESAPLLSIPSSASHLGVHDE